MYLSLTHLSVYDIVEAYDQCSCCDFMTIQQ